MQKNKLNFTFEIWLLRICLSDELFDHCELGFVVGALTPREFEAGSQGVGLYKLDSMSSHKTQLK